MKVTIVKILIKNVPIKYVKIPTKNSVLSLQQGVQLPYLGAVNSIV